MGKKWPCQELLGGGDLCDHPECKPDPLLSELRNSLDYEKMKETKHLSSLLKGITTDYKEGLITLDQFSDRMAAVVFFRRGDINIGQLDRAFN